MAWLKCNLHQSSLKDADHKALLAGSFDAFFPIISNGPNTGQFSNCLFGAGASSADGAV